GDDQRPGAKQPGRTGDDQRYPRRDDGERENQAHAAKNGVVASGAGMVIAASRARTAAIPASIFRPSSPLVNTQRVRPSVSSAFTYALRRVMASTCEVSSWFPSCERACSARAESNRSHAALIRFGWFVSKNRTTSSPNSSAHRSISVCHRGGSHSIRPTE